MWAQVLAEAGPGGLPVGEIADRVQTLGLRDMRTSKAPKVPKSRFCLQPWTGRCLYKPKELTKRHSNVPNSMQSVGTK